MPMRPFGRIFLQYCSASGTVGSDEAQRGADYDQKKPTGFRGGGANWRINRRGKPDRPLSARDVMQEETRGPAKLAMLGSAGLPSPSLLAAKHHARGRCFRYQSVLLVGYGALQIAHRLAPLHDGSFRSESCLPDRAKEVYFQLDRSEGFLRS